MELVLAERLILIRARTHAATHTREHAEHLIQTRQRLNCVTLGLGVYESMATEHQDSSDIKTCMISLSFFISRLEQ